MNDLMNNFVKLTIADGKVKEEQEAIRIYMQSSKPSPMDYLFQ